MTTLITTRHICRFISAMSIFTVTSLSCNSKKPDIKMQSETWKDISGNFINAHGAGVLFHDNRYYLYGEIKKGQTYLVPRQNWEDYRVPAGGISCYSSADFKNWKNEGIALAPDKKDTLNELHTSKVIERPKVIYNEKTKKFVMWMHIDKDDYSLAHAGVAVSDSAAGPFHFISSMRPNGNMSRDMTVFKDNDGTAYLVYSSEDNETMHICKLADDYLSPTEADNRIFIKQSRKAPAMFRYHSKYYLITSACSGWSPNEANYATADDPLKSWTVHGNPCKGPDSAVTYYSQSSFVMPIPGIDGKFLFLADQWNKADLEKSTYLWLPLIVKNDSVAITWSDKVGFK
jgi:hypothetical protein